MSGWIYAAAIVACGVGAMGRYWLGLARRHGQYPWPTLVANVVGSAVLGAAAGAVHAGAPAWVLVIAGAGLAGGITTFSSLSLDAVTLWGQARRWQSVGYLAGTFVLGVAAGGLGWLALA